MLPEWMQTEESYVPPANGGTFAVKTIKALAGVMARVRIQSGHEKKHHLPAIVKLFLMVLFILMVSVTQDRLILMTAAALVLAYLATWPAKDLPAIFKTSLTAALLAFSLFLPAMILQPEGTTNHMLVVGKVFLSVTAVSIFNHTTQWNHITAALRKLHVPGIFIFTLDITLKYIVLLGKLITDLLTSMQLRSVGIHRRKYSSVGGVMGVTFLRGTEMNQQMYEAMRCRGFTDDYKGL